MEQNDEKKGGLTLWQKRQLALALAGTALLALIVSSLAWLNFNRTLQTITRMQMPILWLKEEDGETNMTAIDLGNLNFENPGSNGEGQKDIRFAVLATAKTSYILQLAYTTNLPLTYTIFHTDKNGNIEGDNVLSTDVLRDTYTFAYGDYSADKVQDNAVPTYRQTVNPEPIVRNDLDYYVLRVQWTRNESITTKESEMIYLTVATANEEITPTTAAATAGGGA